MTGRLSYKGLLALRALVLSAQPGELVSRLLMVLGAIRERFAVRPFLISSADAAGVLAITVRCAFPIVT